MRVALVHDWLTGLRGGEKCLDVLCRRFPQASLHTLLHRPGSTSPAIERMQIATSPLQRLPGIASWYRYALPLMPWAIEQIRLAHDTELVVSFSHAAAKGVRVPSGVPHVCYCFTPMRYAWQLRDEYFGPSSRWWQHPLAAVRNRLLDHIQRWDAATSERVTHFIAISQTVAERIRSCYGRESTVIYPPVDTNFYTPDESGLPREDFYLCLSALVPYKRIDLAIEACARLGRRLMIVGSGPERKRLEAFATSLGGSAPIQFLGWQPDLVLRDRLQRCRALLFPGEEDFGIVPLEAQACGTPVIAYARGGATETILAPRGREPGTGQFYYEPTSAALAASIEDFEAQPEAFSACRARENALRFCGERFERELLTFLADTATCQPVVVA